ncbi:hypothetical protein Tco_1373480, partial [Tanacetum coccineum]
EPLEEQDTLQIKKDGEGGMQDHPEQSKKLNDKIPKTMDEMFKRVFIRGEAATVTTKVIRAPQWDKGGSSVGGPKYKKGPEVGATRGSSSETWEHALHM